MKNISVILVDDHEILRYGLSRFLSNQPYIKLKGEAANGEDCITLFKDIHPDVSIVDLNMPGMNGYQLIRSLRSLDPAAKILILSMYTEGELCEQALAQNVNGYLLKSCSKERIAEAIVKISNGETVIGSNIQQGGQARRNADPIFERLTERENEILRYIIGGLSSKEIAEELYISPRTVDTHRNNLLKKLEINNVASLVRIALQHGITPETTQIT